MGGGWVGGWVGGTDLNRIIENDERVPDEEVGDVGGEDGVHTPREEEGLELLVHLDLWGGRRVGGWVGGWVV